MVVADDAWGLYLTPFDVDVFVSPVLSRIGDSGPDLGAL